jgi:hypothetical protein
MTKKNRSGQSDGSTQISRSKENQKQLAKGTADKLIQDSLQSVNLPLDNCKYISKKTISSRVNQSNIFGMKGSFSQSTPMGPIKPVLAEFCKRLNCMVKSINQTEILAQANDIIEGTSISSKLKDYQKNLRCWNKQKVRYKILLQFYEKA